MEEEDFGGHVVCVVCIDLLYIKLGRERKVKGVCPLRQSVCCVVGKCYTYVISLLLKLSYVVVGFNFELCHVVTCS